MNKPIAALAACCILSGCATSAAGLLRRGVDQTIESQKSSSDFATCVFNSLRWDPDLFRNGDHYWVVRNNGYGVPIIRWDFTPREGGGSKAELRSSFGMTVGDERVRACA
jgi:hypothetical protein